MDGDTLLRFAAALLFVLGLIAALAVVARRAGLAPRDPRRRGDPRRLQVVEVTSIDARRRLVLIRRDGVEHLILLGPERETLIEAGIRPDAAPAFAELLPTATPSTGSPS
jgi:flagellar protein FliO/FliZ